MTEGSTLVVVTWAAALALLSVAAVALSTRTSAATAGTGARSVVRSTDARQRAPRPAVRLPATVPLALVRPAVFAPPHALTADNLPADCVPAPGGPPGSPYQLGLVGTAANGVLSTGSATVADISATFCAVVTLVNGTPPCGATGSVHSPQDGQLFGALSVQLTLVPGMNPTLGFTAHPGTITGGFACSTSPAGLLVDLDATVSGSTGAVFGVSCTIGPLTIPLTGVVTGPLTHLTATLTSSDFTVPPVQSSPTCPANTPANVDAIAGLPLAPGQGHVSLPITASLYQPEP